MKHAAPIAVFFPWDQSPNPFLALLASADAAIVTGDSESMTAEAIAAGMPVYLAPVPTRISPRMAVEWSAAWLHGLGGPLASVIRQVWAAGVLLPPRDLGQFLDDLAVAGYAQPLTAETEITLDWHPPPPPDTALADRLMAIICNRS